MEVRSTKFLPPQSFLSDEELDDIIERVMVTVVKNIFQSVALCILYILNCRIVYLSIHRGKG